MRHKTDQTLSFAPALVNARSPTRVSTCPCQPPRSHAPSTAESSASLTGPHSPFLLQGITLPYTLSALSQATPAGTSQASNSHRQRAMSALEAVLWLQPSPSRRAELLTPLKAYLSAADLVRRDGKIACAENTMLASRPLRIVSSTGLLASGVDTQTAPAGISSDVQSESLQHICFILLHHHRADMSGVPS